MNRKNHKLRALSILLVLTLVFAGEISMPFFSYAKNANEQAETATSVEELPADFVNEADDTMGPSDPDNSEDSRGQTEKGSDEETQDGSTETDEPLTELEQNDSDNSTEETPPLKAARAVSNIWIDGTNDGISFYDGASKFEAPSRAFYLPDNDNVDKPSRYNYKLKGWYDVYNNKYYQPGEWVDLSGNNNYTVFYADWVPESYDIGMDIDTVETADTSSFVKVQLFDYNELFNIGESRRPQIRTSLNGHETWNAVAIGQTSATGDPARGLIILDGRQRGGTLAKPGSRPDTTGAYQNLQVSDTGPYPGTVTGNLYGRSGEFFTEDNSVLGVNYVGEGTGLFQYDGNPSSQNYGYYYYDSTKNAAAFNKGDGCFYVYNYTEKTDAAYDQNDFLPFNYGSPTKTYDCGDGPNVGQNLPDDANYWFGMKTEIDFFLPDKSDRVSGSGNLNQAIGNKDMVYRFSGDDDVWVMVDDELVLDLGGIHHIVSGEINFSTGIVTIREKNGTVTTRNFEFNSGDHKLTMYYMERGASQSNCSLYFNIAPRFGLDITKEDKDDPDEKLRDAVFAVYMDEGCTVPAVLWESEDSLKNGDPGTNIFTTDENGKVSCYGLIANRTYYMKEISSPSGYPSVSEKVVAITLDKTGNAVLSGDVQDFAVMSQDGATKKISLRVSNKKPEKTAVNVEKKWYSEDGSPLEGDLPSEILVQLYRSTVESHGGDVTGTSVPINITTQYFGSSNGSNTDYSILTQGDYKINTIAVSGSRLEFTVDVTKDTAGIYSVTANGQNLTPVESSGQSVTECFIGGRWGVHPIRKATYVIDPVTENTEIKVTLIGYLEYGGDPHHPDVSYSMKPIEINLIQPETPETPSVPSVKPENAEPVGEPLVLNAETDWKGIWENLPTEDEEGNTYYYYVEELPVPGYSTSYTGNGTIGGTVTVTNVRLREIIVSKVWKNANGVVMDTGMPESIRAVLVQTDKTTGETREIEFVLDADNGWTKHWRSDDSALGEIEGHEYEYKVREITSIEGYETPVYENNAGISEGSITITNQKTLYTLPDTGGAGTYRYWFFGGFLISLALLLLLIETADRSKGYRRRRKGAGAVSLIAVFIIAASTFSMDVSAETLNTDIPEIDPQRALTLTIDYVYGEKTQVSGVKFEICKIADLTVENSTAEYSFLKEFSDQGDFPDKLTAGDSAGMARTLYRVIKEKGISTENGTTDSKGRVTFTDLTPGMYLAAQVEEREESGKIYWSDPFLVSVPQAAAGSGSGQIEWTYDVIAHPKPVNMKDIRDDSPPDSVKKVKTGDTSDMAAAGIMLILSAAALTLVIILRKKTEEEVHRRE